MPYDGLKKLRLWMPAKTDTWAACPIEIVQARLALAHFAVKQLGAEPAARLCETRVELMYEITAAGLQGASWLAVLDFKQTPRAILAVNLETLRGFCLWQMQEQYVMVKQEKILQWQPTTLSVLPAAMDDLNDMLAALVKDGVIIATADGLRLTRQKPSSFLPAS